LPHEPVLLEEVLKYLCLQPGMVVLDGTIGRGGHATEMLKQIGPHGRLIALDQDMNAIRECRARFGMDQRISLHHENFKNAENVLDQLNIPFLDAVILDIGFSSDQLEDANRGFSFERDGPLDMRMNSDSERCAKDLIRDLSQEELEKIFREYGEERWARRFAASICRERILNPIESTQDLIRVLTMALPQGLRPRKGRRPVHTRRHVGTRVFQALRIVVNDELNALEDGLTHIFNRVKSGGRLAVISFHSLEDRIVKNSFRNWARDKNAVLITKKPLTPTREEIERNSRARSAKLRVLEKSVVKRTDNR